MACVQGNGRVVDSQRVALLRIEWRSLAVTASVAITLLSLAPAHASAEMRMGMQFVVGPREDGCACDREPRRRACQDAWQTKAILIGRVLEITPGRPPELDAPDRLVSTHELRRR